MFGLRTHIPLWAASLLLAMPAKATTTYYVGAANEAAFNAAVGGLTLLNPALTFAGDASGGLFNASGTGIDFLGFDTAFIFNSPQGFTVNAGQLVGNPSEVVKIALPPAGVLAFGTHITVASGSATWCIDLTQAGCGSSVSNSTPSNVQFFGFVSNTPVTAPLYIHYTGGNPTIVFTNFEAFSAAAVPEPHTMLLVGLGLIILPLVRWKRA
jgi:hypothetical protein